MTFRNNENSNAINKHIIIMCLIITFVQALIILYWGSRKENLYWDEFYTLERAHYISASNESEHYIDNDKDFKVGEWMPVSFVKDTLIVGAEETLFNEPVATVLRKLTHAYNYSGFLNLFESCLSLGRFSIWPSIILNICFWMMNQIVLFALCKRLSANPTFPVAVCMLYGFSSMCISMTIFIRFYMYVTFLITLFTYLHFLYFDSDGDALSARTKRLAFLVLSFGVLYLAYTNAQYSVIYGSAFVIGFAVLLLIGKGLRRFLYYSVPMFLGGFIYLYTQTEYISILFDFKNANSISGAAIGYAIDEISGFKLEYIPVRIIDMLHIIGRYLFGSYFAMILFAVIIIIAMMLHRTRAFNGDKKDTFSVFSIVPSIASILFIVFFTVFGLYEQVRYISFVFPELALLAMLMAYNSISTKKYKCTLIASMILVCALTVNVRGKVDMLYTGDKESIERIRGYGADSYVLCTGNHITFMTYEAAVVAENDDEFYVYNDIDDGALDKLSDNIRDKMIVVNYHGESAEDVHNMLKEKGYKVDWIADTYKYVFYTAVCD